MGYWLYNKGMTLRARAALRFIRCIYPDPVIPSPVDTSPWLNCNIVGHIPQSTEFKSRRGSTNDRTNRLQLIRNIRSRHFGLLSTQTRRAIRQKGFQDTIASIVNGLRDSDVPMSQLSTKQLKTDIAQVIKASLQKLVPENCRAYVTAELYLGFVKNNLEQEFDPTNPKNLYNFVFRWLTQDAVCLQYPGTPQSVATKYVNIYYGKYISCIEELSEKLGVLKGEELFFNKTTNYFKQLADGRLNSLTLRDLLTQLLANIRVLQINDVNCQDKDLDEELDKFRSLMADIGTELSVSFDFQSVVKFSNQQMKYLDYCLTHSYWESPRYDDLFQTGSLLMVEFFADHFAEVYFGRKERIAARMDSAEERGYWNERDRLILDDFIKSDVRTVLTHSWGKMPVCWVVLSQLYAATVIGSL
ncbi:hypothetical protein LSH36_295g03092 [Paralvinella palmiformis]|uniref:Uncharacterized protein n=1 Tax=Paralvinella palmiformis TaxID=53620 RepID=A0AAD9JJS6_9ANNE|nr:hypothetical protein LSH36_295g03092 [Paralvinella palmiformis]